MPNVLPTIPNDPPQGIQALLDKVYLWNPDVSNELIEKINALLAKLGDAIGAIRPYSELVAPISQYEPCYYGSGVYVAARELDKIPMEFNEADWILIATKGVTAEEAAQTYLPLTGGEMTGLLTLNATEKPQYSFQSASLLQIKAETADGTTKLNKNIQITPGGILNMDGLSLSSTGSISCMPTGDYDIGSQTIKWRRVYATGLNNGADIAVPTEGGTLARVEDINAIGGDGTTGQVLTKTAEGMAWQDAAGGGDYLPLSGGTMTGVINFDYNSGPYGTEELISWKSNEGFNQRIRTGQGGSGIEFAFLNTTMNFSETGALFGITQLGTQAQPVSTIYTNKLSTKDLSGGGGDLIVPTESGTLARIEDINATVGDISTALTAILGE